MLTGTPLDLTPFGPLLGLLGIAYWLLALAAAALALWLPKRWRVKVPLAALVLVGFAYPLWHRVEKGEQQHDEAKARLEAALALFAERCKTAGEKITRTLDNVDGVVWMKWREKHADNLSDQWKLNDFYGRDCGAEDCISNLLRVTKGQDLRPDEAKRHAAGYRFVETIDPGDGERYRYTAAIKVTHQRTAEQLKQYKKNTGKDPGLDVIGYAIERKPANVFGAHYGITWDDISTHEDREHWIAGGSLKVIDLQTNEVIAERIGYMVDRGQGSQVGFRSPWLEAVQSACPSFPGQGPSSPRPKRDYVETETRRFAFRVLRPSQGD